VLVLASASPRRKELISLIREDVIIHPSNADETVPDNISSDSVAEFLAVKKAAFVAKSFPCDTVIGCDTVVLVDGVILGKPENKEDAVRMLNILSGKTHQVITGCAIFKNGKSLSFSEVTDVSFFPLSEEEINAYVNTLEPMDKAGAYGIQGYGALLVKEIKGDFFNVVGLPVARLNRILKGL